MGFSPPGFFEDTMRHDLAYAWQKRFGSLRIDGKQVRYADVVGLAPPAALAVMGRALNERDNSAACWAFESLLLKQDLTHAFADAVAIVVAAGQSADEALAAVALLLRYVDVENYAALERAQLDPYSAFLVGKGCAAKAMTYREQKKGAGKTEFKTLRRHALRFFSNARAGVAEGAFLPVGVSSTFVAVQAAEAYDDMAVTAYKGRRKRETTAATADGG